jgi:hypothetical protein
MNQFLKKVTSVVVAATFLVAPGSAFAKAEGKARGLGRAVSAKVRIAELDTSCLKDAAKAFVAAIRAANAEYRSSRDTVRATLKDSLKAADTRADKRAAIDAYRSSMKIARDKMKADKKAALATFRASKDDCRTTEDED